MRYAEIALWLTLMLACNGFVGECRIESQSSREPIPEQGPAGRAATLPQLPTLPGFKQVTQLNTEDCDFGQADPGVVMADFDGDGAIDFAVLFESASPEGVVEWAGRKWPRVQVVLNAYLGNRDKTLRTVTLMRLEDYHPISMFIGLQVPGRVAEFDTTHDVSLARPGILLTYCGKASIVYYWDGTKFVSIPISD